MVSAGNEPSTPPTGRVSDRGDEDEGSLFVQVAAWVLTAMLLYGAAFWVLGWIYSGHPGWPGLHHKPAMYDLARSSVGVAGILGGAAAIAVALRRQRSTEKSVRIAAEAQQTAADAQKIAARAQQVAADAQKIDVAAYQLDLRRTENDRVTALRGRYTEAARQLGDDSAAVRLAGAYAMAALADDWITRNDEMVNSGGAAWERDPDAQACIDVLCAYIRTPRRYPGDHAPINATDEGDDDTEYRADREVRQTIVRITRDHLRGEAPTSWGAFDLDYTGAIFEGTYDFTDAQFSGGTVLFTGAEFAGGTVLFIGAKFAGSKTRFFQAKFSGATVLFERARFSGRTVSFDGAQFSDGRVSFDRAQFCDGHWVSFDFTTFSGSTVSFRRAKFCGGLMTFSADLSGGSVSFSDAEFSGGVVDFTGTLLAAKDAFPAGPWDDSPSWLTGEQLVWPPRSASLGA